MKSKIAVTIMMLMCITACAYAVVAVWGYTYKQYVGTFMPTGVSVRAESEIGNSGVVQNYQTSGDTTKYQITTGLVLNEYYFTIHAWKSDEWEGHNYNGFVWGGENIQRNVVLQVMP
jgi:hypothetical protein